MSGLSQIVLKALQARAGVAASLDLTGLAESIAALAGAAPAGEFERRWRAALLAGAPADLAAVGLEAVLEAGAADLHLLLRSAGRACEIAHHTAAGSDAGQALAGILQQAGPGELTGVVMLGLPEFLDLPCAQLEDWSSALVGALARRLRAEDWLLQLSSREWVLLMPGLRSAAQLPLAAQALSAACGGVLAQHFGAQPETVSTGASVAPLHGTHADQLLAGARAAMLQARVAGEPFCFADTAHAQACADHALGLEFSRALQSNALRLHFQPQVMLRDGRCEAVEALLRWQDAAGEWIAPPHMIAMATRLGLLSRLCDWLIAEACRVASRLAEAGYPLRVAINLTAQDFYDIDLPERVRQLTATWGCAPQRLVIEVTETTLIAQPRRARQVFEALRALGCRISLDDFGTGYSSLAYLRELPVDEIKIDRCFIAEAASEPRAAAIVRSIIALGDGLGLNVIGEGAEDALTMDWLRQEGCAVVQGYGAARPMPEENLSAWLRDSSRR